MRVLPSSSTVTMREPLRISATSTRTGFGHSAQRRAPMRPATPRTIRPRLIRSVRDKCIGLLLIPGFQNRDEVEPVNTTANVERGGHGCRKHDEARLGISCVLDDEWHPVEVTGERLDQQPAEAVT